jgi:hypothetical protein
MSANTDARVIIQRGNLTGTGGAQAAPGNGATITILDTSDSGHTAWKDRLPFNRIQVSIFSSHDSGASGVVFSSSFDRGANFRTQSSQTYLNANGATTYDYLLKGGHVKVAYTNSANALTAWEMEVVGVYDRNPGS